MAVPNSLLGGFGGGFNAGNAIAQSALDTRNRNRLADLASQAYGAAPQQQNALIGQAIQTDPDAGFALDRNIQATEEQRQKGLVNAAKMLTSTPAEYRDGVYQRMRPSLERRYGMTNLPASYDETVDGVVQQLAALGADGAPAGYRQFEMMAEAAGLKPGTDEYRRAAAISLGTEGRASSSGAQTITVEGPDGRPRQFTFDPRTGGYVPAQLGLPAQPQMAPGEVPFSIDPSLPPEVQASIRANPQQWAQAPEVASSPGMPAGGSPFVGRTPEEEAAAVEAARQQVELQNLPRRQAIETDGAIDRLEAEQRVERMPAAVMKMVQESEEKAGTAAGILQRMQGHKQKILSGELQFGPVSNLVSQGRNFAGRSNEQSRNLQLFMSDLEKMRNDSLRLNNGVQTEGDAQRAWNELFANLNDTQYVLAGLDRIEAINQRAAQAHAARAQEIRASYPQGGARQPQPATAPQQPAQGGWGIERAN